MDIHTISAYETTASKFFGCLEEWKIDLALDVRLKNTNQLAGFTKRDDLAYFVKRLTGAEYKHDLLFAPAPTLFERYIHGNIDWDAYALRLSGRPARAQRHRAVLRPLRRQAVGCPRRHGHPRPPFACGGLEEMLEAALD